MANFEAAISRRGGAIVRCAVYTRKSSEEGLEQDFNSLHAQREACEAYVKSQKHEGWVVLPAQYDDGGISGATMERPALQFQSGEWQSLGNRARIGDEQVQRLGAVRNETYWRLVEPS